VNIPLLAHSSISAPKSLSLPLEYLLK
jgi:hypothetical protein